MALCPNCRHEVSRHSSSHECDEPGCSCLFDPRSIGAARFRALDAARVPFLVMREQPYFPLVLLSFSVMAVYFGIEELEAWAPAADWMARHRSPVTWIKAALCLISIPGLAVLWFWSPGMKAKDYTKPGPRWILTVLVGLIISFLLYYALQVFLARR